MAESSPSRNPAPKRVQEFQAVILTESCDGDGLYPLTERTPPALLPVANRPLLSFQLELLERAAGFQTVFVLATETYLAQLSKYVSELYKGALQVELVKVPEGLGSADALRHIAPKLDRDFVLVSCDLITDLPFQRMADLHRLHGAAVTALFKEGEPREPGEKKKAKALSNADFVGLDERRQRLLSLESAADATDTGELSISQSLLRAQPHLQVHTNLLDAHLYIFAHWALEVLELKPHFSSAKFELLPYLVRKQFLSKGNLPQARLAAGRSRSASHALGMSASPARRQLAREGDFRCGCYVMPHSSGYCVRVNTLAAYTQASLDVARGGVTHFERPPEPQEAAPAEGNFVLRSLSADSARGEGVEVGARSSVKRSCIGPHCRIGAAVRLTNCIIMDHVTIGDKVNMSNCIVCSNAEVGEGASLKDAQVAQGMRVEAGAVHKGEAVAHDDFESEASDED